MARQTEDGTNNPHSDQIDRGDWVKRKKGGERRKEGEGG